MRRTGPILRCGLSGVCATTLDVCTLVFLVEIVRAPVGIAAFFGASVGAVTNFLINKFWSFRDPTPIEVKQVTTFALVAFCTCTFVAVTVHFLAIDVGIPYLGAKAIAAVLVFLLWTYPAQSRIVFGAATAARLARLQAEVAAELIPE